jgi:CRISPR/Cas system-associated exonuclease Cas4 (RecB family)
MRTIRASEVNTYLYCRRAWYFMLSGEQSENSVEFASGIEIHYRHNRTVIGASSIRIIAYTVLLLAIVLMVIYLASMMM